MDIIDTTLDKKFSELPMGSIFTLYSQYYMKVRVRFLDYSNEYMEKSLAVNLKTGAIDEIKDDEKLRIVTAQLFIGGT